VREGGYSIQEGSEVETGTKSVEVRYPESTPAVLYPVTPINHMPEHEFISRSHRATM
jgi:hypothetical protein